MIFSITTLVAAILTFVLRNNKINHLITIAYSMGLGVFTYSQFLQMGQEQWVYFKPDSLGIIFLFVLALLGFFTAIQYRNYANKRNEEPRTVANHNAAYILFLAALAGVNLTNHFGLLWAFIEATTLTGSVLIYHDRDKLALEAVWKYIFVASVSIALAFAGILFLSIGLQELQLTDLSFTTVKNAASQLDPVWLKASFLFILTGFSVKMGIFPMFSVDIDAKDTSPSPVGAMFSSVLLNAGFIAIMRFYIAFSGSAIQPWMNHVLMITGFLSIFIAASYLIRVNNFKRIFAYSSTEHAGLIILAISMGSRAGFFAAILHSVFHSLVKAGLFYQIGQMYRAFKSKILSQVGGYFFINPLGGLVLLIGLFSIIALPPSGMFISEFLIFKAFLTQGHLWLAISVMLMLTLIIYTLSKSVLRLLFVKPKNGAVADGFVPEKISPYLSLSQLFLMGLTVYLGFAQPAFFIDLVNQAVALI